MGSDYIYTSIDGVNDLDSPDRSRLAVLVGYRHPADGDKLAAGNSSGGDIYTATCP